MPKQPQPSHGHVMAYTIRMAWRCMGIASSTSQCLRGCTAAAMQTSTPSGMPHSHYRESHMACGSLPWRPLPTCGLLRLHQKRPQAITQLLGV